MVNLKNDWPWIWGFTVSIIIVLGGGLFFIGSMVELPGLATIGEETYDPIVGSGAFEEMSDDSKWSRPIGSLTKKAAPCS